MTAAKPSEDPVAGADYGFGAHLPTWARHGLAFFLYAWPEGHLSRDVWAVVFGSPDWPMYRDALDRLVNRMRLGVRHPTAKQIVRDACRDLGQRHREYLRPVFYEAIANTLEKLRTLTTVRFGRAWLTDARGRKREIAPGWHLTPREFWPWLQVVTYREATRLILAEHPDRRPHPRERRAWPAPQLPTLLHGKPSKRQGQLLYLLGKGFSLAASARKLGLAESTARVQLWRLRTRMGVAAAITRVEPRPDEPGCPFCGGRIVRRKCKACGVALAEDIHLADGRVRRGRRQRYSPTRARVPGVALPRATPRLGDSGGRPRPQPGRQPDTLRMMFELSGEWHACIQCSQAVKTRDARPLCPACAKRRPARPYTTHLDPGYWDED